MSYQLLNSMSSANAVNNSRINVDLFVWEDTLKLLKFSKNRNKSVTKANICSEKHNNCLKIFLLLTNVAVVLVPNRLI